MLMITEHETTDALTFKLAGALAGDSALEFERCWGEANASPNMRGIRVDLSEVVAIDDVGKRLLAQVARSGAEMITGDVLMKSIVEEIAAEPEPLANQKLKGKTR
jgi:anti-anti-sigma regulatory factor